MQGGSPFHAQRFVIAAMSWSGAYPLASLLDSATDINCYGEIYRGSHVELPPDIRQELRLAQDDTQVRNDTGFALFDRLEQVVPSPLLGFKILPSQAKIPIIDETLRNPHWKKVVLKRNPLEVFLVSEWAARNHMGRGHRIGEVEQVQSLEPVAFDGDKFDVFLRRYRQVYKTWREMSDAFHPDTWFRFNHPQSSRPRPSDQLLDFLGSSARGADLVNERHDIPVESVTSLVDNYETLAAHLNNRGMSHLLKGDCCINQMTEIPR